MSDVDERLEELRQAEKKAEQELKLKKLKRGKK